MNRMPLIEFHQKCELLLGHLKVFMKHFFETVTSVDDCNVSLETPIVDIKKRHQDIVLCSLENSLTLSGVKSISENLNALDLRTNIDNIRKLIDDVNAENERLDFQYEMAHNDVKLQTNNDLNTKISSILNQYLNGKNKRAM
jgi:predicted nuclease with TOPRIM domain